MGDMSALVAVAAGQHGVFTTAQARACGFEGDAILRRVRSGQWIRPQRGVLAVNGHDLGWMGRLMAGCLATGGVASHRSVAVLQGFDGFRPGYLELTVERGHRGRRPGLLVHQSRDYDLRDETVIDGIPSTGVGRMLLDLGLKVSLERQADAIDEGIRRKLVTWPDLYEVLITHARRGRDGVGPFRAILDERYGSRVPESSWSRKVERLLVDGGLPRPELEYEVRTEGGSFLGRVDLAYPDEKIAIELQSKRWHLNDTGFERDAKRRNALQLAGWLVLEYTWRAYVDTPERIISEVKAHRRARLRQRPRSEDA
jgi:hypothetical protein